MTKYFLKDLSIIIPYYKDSQDREENLICICNYLNKHLETNIIILEAGEPTMEIPSIFGGVCYVNVPDAEAFKTHGQHKIFHRTHILNMGIRMSTTPYIALFDTDIILAPEQYLKGVELLRQGITMVYPYDGHWTEIDHSYAKTGIAVVKAQNGTGSLGGVVFLNRERYMRSGMECEYYIGYAPEDVDRKIRMEKLGYSIARVPGDILHIAHSRTIQSRIDNPFHGQGIAELNRIKGMTHIELESEVKTWSWARPTIIPDLS